MQSKQEDRMSRKEIVKYVDKLIKQNKKTYDKMLSKLLYEFFLRANEKFEWSREEFLEKYQNFSNNVKIIKFEEIESLGRFSVPNRAIYLNKQILEIINILLENNIINNYIIDNLFHECLHATDLQMNNGKIAKWGLTEVIDDYSTNERDTMFDEYANVLSASLISSDKPMYEDNLGINVINIGSYRELNFPGSIICSALDIQEIELAKLKDKGIEKFNLYLKDKFQYVNTELLLDIFKINLNLINNADNNVDKENIALGVGNIVDASLIAIESRIKMAFIESSKTEELLERSYYSVYKIKRLLEKVDAEYEIEDDKDIYNFERFEIIDNLLNRLKLYKSFLDNKDLFTNAEKGQIYNSIIHYNKDKNDIDLGKEIIESKFDKEYQNEEFNIEEIAKKYYLQSNESLNDNTELIEKVKKSFTRQTIKEKLEKVIQKVKNKKTFLLLESGKMIKTQQLPMQSNKNCKTNLRNSVKYETPIIHDISTEQQKVLIDNEESTRDENEDIR